MESRNGLISYNDILEAKKVIDEHIIETPIIQSKNIGYSFNINLTFKAELFQRLGSFKLRGVMNKLSHLSDEEKSKGVATISAGNHAQSLAYAASKLKIPAVVIMPDTAPKVKIQKTKNLGAEVILTKGSNGLLDKLQKVIAERDLTLVHPFDDPDIIAGQGTIGLEIIKDSKKLPDYVIVPVGGGGLISGIATAIKSKNPEIKVIGIEPEGANAMYRSLRENKVVTLEALNTIADGLAAPFAGKFTLEHVKKYVNEIVLVSDSDIIRANQLLLTEENILTEPAGAASVAGLLSKIGSKLEGTNVLCVLSGGNIDINLLKKILE